MESASGVNLVDETGVPSGMWLGFARAISRNIKLSDHAARSIGCAIGLAASICEPSTLRMLIWPEASKAHNSMAAVSADGSTVCVLILV